MGVDVFGWGCYLILDQEVHCFIISLSREIANVKIKNTYIILKEGLALLEYVSTT